MSSKFLRICRLNLVTHAQKGKDYVMYVCTNVWPILKIDMEQLFWLVQ